MSSIELLRKLEALPPEKRQEVFDFVDFLLARSGTAESASPSFYGLWADLGIDLSPDDLDAVCSELRSGFAREDLP